MRYHATYLCVRAATSEVNEDEGVGKVRKLTLGGFFTQAIREGRLVAGHLCQLRMDDLDQLEICVALVVKHALNVWLGRLSFLDTVRLDRESRCRDKLA